MIVMKKYLSQIILLMMFIPVFAQEKSSSSSGDVKVLNASNFTAETAKGVVLVDFWATWCMPCLGEMPYFNELSKQFPNIQFVGISLDDNTEVWLNKLKGDADHGKVLELFSTDPLVRTGWDITGIPRFLLIDKDFNIISASAPRPSEKDVIVPLLEKYNKK
mgnify:CR=1 FL=1